MIRRHPAWSYSHRIRGGAVTRVISRTLAVLTTATASLALAGLASSPASASSPRIGPSQFYTATINGSTGQSAPVSIGVICPGPIASGETGHPLPDQMIAVAPSASVAGGTGKTGAHANSIAAFFGAPPPAPAANASHVVFKHYQTKPLPHSLLLPCGGSGTVTFLSFPLEPQSSVSIPVTYFNPTATPRR